MRRIVFPLCLLGLILTLGACASGHQPLKAPCPPMLGYGSPCEESSFYKVDL